jgi:tripartite-type tricarboxylate transporter receptor subunit TctC
LRRSHLVATVPFVLVVHPALAAKSLAELIALAKANPGKLNYASVGHRHAAAPAGELFKSMASIDVVHVPFREANAALNAVVGGSVEMMFSIASTSRRADERAARCAASASPSSPPRRLFPACPRSRNPDLPGFR